MFVEIRRCKMDKYFGKVLKQMHNNELQALVDIILKRGVITPLWFDRYFRACREMGFYKSPRCIGLIDADFRKFGGNSIDNFKNGTGPSYKAIAIDVCKKFNIIASPSCRMRDIETALLDKVLGDMWKNMDDEQRHVLLISLDVQIGVDSDFYAEGLAALLMAFHAGGFASYQLLVIIANTLVKTLIGRGLSLAANAGLTKLASIVTGPIGTALTALWVVKDAVGPAYRVTIPVVVYISAIRQIRRLKRKSRKEEVA